MQKNEQRHWVSAVLAIGAGAFVLSRYPFPAENALLQIVLFNKPTLYLALRYAYAAMCFTTPYITLSVLGSLVYIFTARFEQPTGIAKLPRYPDPALRESLYLVLGEVHHAKRPEPSQNPGWLTVPERGLYTGVAIFGEFPASVRDCCPSLLIGCAQGPGGPSI